jgi:NADH-quinone oxidoreductase subunit B
MSLHASPAPERRYRVEGHHELRVVILDVGLACCALEVGAAITAGLLVTEMPSDTTPVGRVVSVLLISGTVTDALAPGVIRAWGALEEPRLAVSFGACANTGGPYWDAPTVTKGIDQLIPIAVYIPGCPPRPEALIAGLVRLALPAGLTHSDPNGEPR